MNITYVDGFYPREVKQEKGISVIPDSPVLCAYINGTRTAPSRAFQNGLDLTERTCVGQAALTFVSLSVKCLS